MKKVFVINVLIIMVASLLFNTIGITFRVYLSNKIGTEGMGLFQLIISIYIMATQFVVRGISIAVTRLVAEEGGRKSFLISRSLLTKAFSVSFLFSISAFIFLFLGADFIGTVCLHDQRTILSLKLLAVSMPFMGISSCIKGYFNGISKLIRPISSQALELVIQIIIIMNILDYFAHGGLEYACAAIVLGMTIAEIASCLYMLTFYWLEIKKNDRKTSETLYHNRIFKKLIYISFPVSASAFMRSGLKALENIMIPIGLVTFGFAKNLALAEYGKIQGMVMPILFFPASVLLAFAGLLIPEISEANALNQKKRVSYSITRALQLTFLLSILVAGIFATFYESLGLSIYNNVECGTMMRVLAPIVPLMYLDAVVDELLKGLNQQVSTLKYNMIDAVIRIILIYYLIPIKGVPGFVFVLYVSSILNTSLSVLRLLKVSEIKHNISGWIIKPVLSIFAAGFLTRSLLVWTNCDNLPAKLHLIVGTTITAIIYLFFLIRLNCITKDDIHWFKRIFMFKYSQQ